MEGLNGHAAGQVEQKTHETAANLTHGALRGGDERGFPSAVDQRSVIAGDSKMAAAAFYTRPGTNHEVDGKT